MRAALVWAALALVGCGDDDRQGRRDDAAVDSDTIDDVAVDSDAIDDVAVDSDAIDDVADTDAIEDVAVDSDAIEDSAGDSDAIEDSADTNEEVVLEGEDLEGQDSTEALDEDTEPCDAPEHWPFSILSTKRPVRVHYRERADQRQAREVASLIDDAWDIEVAGGIVGNYGFRAPLLDDGACGEDAAIDIFLWRDAPEAYVNTWTENRATAWDDGAPYMVVDPWGEFGGDELGITLAHEFNHMCQAAYDWSDAGWVYEATSTYMEDEVYDDNNDYRWILYDFQGQPEWSVDRDDGYETWYMYGAMLYLRYVRDRFFEGDGRWISRMWEGMRSPFDDNEPDVVDSLDALLAPHGVSYADTVIEFARWRWYVGPNDDGRHLEEAGDFHDDSSPRVAATLTSAGGQAQVRPMMLGTSYVDLTGDEGDEVTVSLTTNASDAIAYVVQAVPGLDGDDGEVLTLPAVVRLGAAGRTLIVTVLPALPGNEDVLDPDERTDTRYPATIQVSPAP